MIEKIELTEEELATFDPCLHEVVKMRGAKMVTLVLEAGVAREAGEVLVEALAHLPARDKAQAFTPLRILIQSLNVIANALAHTEGWTHEELSDCGGEVERALSRRIVTPQGPKIILAH